jgi:hypothetical protein
VMTWLEAASDHTLTSTRRTVIATVRDTVASFATPPLQLVLRRHIVSIVNG